MIHRSILTVFCSILLLTAVSAPGQTTPSDGDKSVGTAPAAGAVAMTRQDDNYRIGYRDKLNVQVFRHPELSQTVTVNPSGTINLFRIPEPVVAVCKTQLELANDIAAAYKKDYLKNPEVQVTAAEQTSQQVSVIDAVVKPGSFYLNRKVHLLELIALAGGPAKEAGSRVLVARMGSTSACDRNVASDDKIELFNFKISDLQEGKQTFMIQPGDVVSVQKADIVFVYGNVNEQGQVEMKQPMTLRQAIASAGGTKSATNKGKVRIIRQKPGSLEREEILVDLNAVNNQKAEDPFLQPNDIIALSEDRLKSIVNSVTKSFTQGIPSLLYRPY
jgi:polysaccharide biosynthesis/export protein